MPTLKSSLRIGLLGVIVLLTPPLGYAGFRYASGNIHEVQPGVFYRSGQLDGDTLEQLIDRKNIRTIVNLRGSHPDEAWYNQEASIAEGRGVRYIPIAISARSVPDMSKMMAIADAVREAPGPILVHCMGGSDRAGLASAIYELVVQGKSEEEAAEQLSFTYGHLPWLGSRTVAMDRAFEQFADHWKPDERGVRASDHLERTQIR